MSNYESPIREPLITGDKSYSQITTDIVGTTEKSPPMSWFIAFGIAGACATFGVVGILYLLWQGVGVWGLNRTVNWAWDITNFVWWVGIGHARNRIIADAKARVQFLPWFRHLAVAPCSP